MKNPWKVLEIQPTTDPAEIKKAYRILVQKYHPDKAKTPEKQRKYTIRFVEIREAYEAALQYAQHQAATPREAGASSVPSSPIRGAAPWQEWVKAAFLLTGGAIGILLLVVTGLYARSFPETHLFPITFIAVLSIIIGCFAGGFLFVFLLMYFYMPIQFGILEKIGLEKYADKLGWMLSVMLWVLAISQIGIPELNVRQIGNAVTWFVAFGVGPVLVFGIWIADYIKYKKVKGKYLSMVANHSIQSVTRNGI